MEFIGTVQGEAAKRYAGFTYRKPVLAPVDAWNIDPDRLHPANEYPRFVSPPSAPNTRHVDLADYVVKIGDNSSNGMSRVQLWMRPNEYTTAKAEKLVLEFDASNAFTLRRVYHDEALRRAFGET